jgi:TP901 family phage tail tape measure protein
MAKGKLVVRLIGDDRDLRGKLQKSQSDIKKWAAIGAGAAAGVAVTLFKMGSGFDDAFDTIRVGTGATGESLNALKDDFRAVVANVPADFASAGTAVADLNTRLGLSGKPLQDMAGQILNLSRITKTDLNANIAAATRVFGDWSIAADDQGAALDRLFVVSQKTGIGVGKLADMMVQFGAPMRELGFSFDETAALLGKFEQEGVNAELVMGGLKQGLGRLAKAGKDPREEMFKLMDSIDQTGLTAQNKQRVFEIFGARAGIDMAKAIEEGRFELSDLLGVIDSSGETINKASDDTADFSEQWQLFKNKAMLALEPVAKRVFEGLGNLVKELGPKFEAAFGVIKDLLSDTKRLLEEHGPVILTITGLIAAVFIPHWIALGVQATINAAKAAAAWVLTKIEAIKAAVVHSAQVILMVAKWVWMGVQAVLHAARVVAGWVMTSVGAIAAGIVHVAQAALFVAKWAWMGAQALIHAAKVAVAWLIAMGPIGLIILAVGALTALVILKWNEIKDFLAGIGRTIWEPILGGVRWLVDKILGFFGMIIEGAALLFGWVPGVGPKLKEAAAKFRVFRDDVNGFLGGIDKDVQINIRVKLPENFQNYKDMEWNAGGVPQMAKGGTIARAGFAIVGERGPELLSLGRGATVTPLRPQGAASRGPVGPVIHIENYHAHDEADIEALQRRAAFAQRAFG